MQHLYVHTSELFVYGCFALTHQRVLILRFYFEVIFSGFRVVRSAVWRSCFQNSAWEQLSTAVFLSSGVTTFLGLLSFHTVRFHRRLVWFHSLGKKTTLFTDNSGDLREIRIHKWQPPSPTERTAGAVITSEAGVMPLTRGGGVWRRWGGSIS